MATVMILAENEAEENALTIQLNKIGIAPSPYKNIIEARWFEELNFCNCGRPEDARTYLLRLLAAYKERTDSDWENDTVNDALKAEEFDTFILYVLDAMGLTEHGGSVFGAWLTSEGEQLLKELQNNITTNEGK